MNITREQKDQIIGWRRFFHQNPETSLHEFSTSNKIYEILQSFDIPVYRVGSTGVCGEITGGKGSPHKTVLLRADIDALGMEEQNRVSYRSQNPGAAHACGHDGHIAALLGAARILKQNESNFSGKVKLVFQPAEEICRGAKQIIDSGELENVDCVLGIHFMPSLACGKIACQPGPVMAGCDFFKIIVHGKGGHISTPQLAADPILAGAQILVGLQTIAVQRFSPLENILIAVGKFNGGTQYNIIPDESSMEGTIRCYNNGIKKSAMNAIRETAENIAAAYRTSAEVIFEEYTPPTINSEEPAILGQRVAADLIGKENVITDDQKSLAGDDFAFYLQKVPGLYAKIGSADPLRPETQHPLHHPCFDIDENALIVAAEFYANYALSFLE
jgi:amidohydrolase